MATIGFEHLIDNSDKFQALRTQLRVATRLSLTGITNLVVRYEEPCLVDSFLEKCFKKRELYRETYDIDAVELQSGRPGEGIAAAYLDSMIFGSCTREGDTDGIGVQGGFLRDNRTGKRKRNPDGFVNRTSLLTGEAEDKLLVIKNLDYCLDFCEQRPGHVDARSLWILDNFRNANVKLGCRILLITNERLRLPFKIRTVELEPVDDLEATHIIEGFVDLYNRKKYELEFTESQTVQMKRKLCGLTYTEAADAFGEALSNAEDVDNKVVNPKLVLKRLREKVNANLMEDAQGLTHLEGRPWEDYICPESSNFTYDVKKILRDFEEIDTLKNNDKFIDTVDAIRARMPHVIILYGKGGVGKSAFPVHFAGLLDFDVWDFNIGASHSKFVGEGAERMREALKKISLATHLVVRIDEYDRAIGATAASGEGMHEAHKQVESEFMNWLQNSQEDNMFVQNDIFLVLTTNHKENITGPMLRSGRADLVIDIADFDEKSMMQTFMTAPTRMMHRNVPLIGIPTVNTFKSALDKLDLDQLVSLVTAKSFTVRDVDVLLQEMAAHHYYYRRKKEGLAWTTENFIKVIENSVGSNASDDTCELILGDRFILQEQQEEESQRYFSFFNECGEDFDLDSFKKVDFFQ